MNRSDDELSGSGAEKARIERALKESEARFRTVFDAAQDAIYIETTDGRILDVNQAVCDMLGYTREEMLKLRVRDIVPPDRAASLPAEIRKESARRGAYIETENLRKDGTRVPVEVSNTIVELDGEKKVIAIVRDISLRKKAEEDLKKMEEQLRQAQKMETAAALAGGVAHDFGNLLNAVRGSVEGIRARLAPGDPLLKEISGLDQAVSRAGGLIRKLLTLGRREQPREEAVNLNLVLGGLAPMLQRVCARPVHLTFDLEEGLGEITAAREQIEQVVINLVLNAREAIAGAGTVSVATKTADLSRSPVTRMIGKKPGTYVALIVADTGRGMSKTEKARLFEPFFTTKSSEGNSGLGLSVVYGIVESYGGFIQVESAPDQGSALTVYFPLRKVSPAGPRRRPRVLLVDPELEPRNAAMKTLAGLGYEVTPASYGLMAAEFFRLAREAGRPFDVVLLGLPAPGVSGGADTVDLLREIDPEVLAVLSADHPGDPVAAGFREHGFAAALGRPFTAAALESAFSGIGVPPPPAAGSAPGPAGGGS